MRVTKRRGNPWFTDQGESGGDGTANGYHNGAAGGLYGSGSGVGGLKGSLLRLSAWAGLGRKAGAGSPPRALLYVTLVLLGYSAALVVHSGLGRGSGARAHGGGAAVGPVAGHRVEVRAGEWSGVGTVGGGGSTISTWGDALNSGGSERPLDMAALAEEAGLLPGDAQLVEAFGPQGAGAEGGASRRLSKLEQGAAAGTEGAEGGERQEGASGPDGFGWEEVSDEQLQAALRALPPANRTLRFQVCNGFTNQRLAIVYGALLARRTSRAIVLPDLIDNGLQRSDAAVMASEGNTVPFGDMYDTRYFLYRMALAGIRVLQDPHAPPASSASQLSAAAAGWGLLGVLSSPPHAAAQHVSMDCPLFKMVPGELGAADGELMWAVLDALRPNREAWEMVGAIGSAIRRLGGEGGDSAPRYNFIHLRIENDWVAHCSRWESIHDGVVRDNCYRHTEEVEEQLALFGFSTALPLYVGSYWQDVEPERMGKVMGRLAQAGFELVTSADVFPPAMAAKGREFRAMVEYFVGMGASRFIGNSVSTFAALGLVERRHRGRWAAYYNGGNIPLASVMPPLHRLPWVFTYNSWSSHYDYMLKAAVRSAHAVRSFKPYCIFQGNESAPIHAWLRQHNVTIIRHVPKWRDELVVRAKTKAKDNVAHSHLYKTPDMLVSTFQRVDLPVVPLLDQYTYVLYTDCDVYFRRPMRLDDFGLPLPASVSMSFEFVNMFPYNAGIIVANLPVMRRNYPAFIAMMLDNEDGLYYPNYGPADQGILNKFYEHDLRSRMLSQSFNTKPYNGFDPNSFIVHYHGPKPHDYANWLATGKCDFYTVCETGYMGGLCEYTREWVEHVPEEPVAAQLLDGCAWLHNPIALELVKKKWGLSSNNGVGIPDDKKALFSNMDRLRDYIHRSQRQLQQQQQQQRGEAGHGSAAAGNSTASSGGRHELTERQQALLKALRVKRQAQRRAAAQAALAQRAAAIAELASHVSKDDPGRLQGIDSYKAVTADEKEMDAAWASAGDGAGGEEGEADEEELRLLREAERNGEGAELLAGV